MVIEELTSISDIGIRKINFRKLCQKAIPSTIYLTHGMHKYTARLIPYIPRYFIQRYMHAFRSKTEIRL